MMVERGQRWFAALALVAWTASSAGAVVLCAPKVRRTGELKEGAPLRLRTACKAKELQVDPAALGLQGPPGEQGLPGAQGDPGPAGAPGLSGLEVVVVDGQTVVQLVGGTGTATAPCPAGKKVLGGGIEVVEDVGDLTSVTKVESFPVTTDPQGWSGLVRGNSSDDWHLRAYAICANAS